MLFAWKYTQFIISTFLMVTLSFPNGHLYTVNYKKNHARFKIVFIRLIYFLCIFADLRVASLSTSKRQWRKKMPNRLVARRMTDLLDVPEKKTSGTFRGTKTLQWLKRRWYIKTCRSIRLHAQRSEASTTTVLRHARTLLPGLESLHSMLSGHTKFAPDWCSGILKRAFRKAEVHCLENLTNAVYHSSKVGHNRAY